MRRTLLVLVVMGLALPASGQPTQTDPLVHDLWIGLDPATPPASSTTTVNLQSDAGATLYLVADVEDPDFGGEIVSVEFVFPALGVSVFATDPSNFGGGGIETWQATMPVNHPDLVKGTHNVELIVQDRNSGETRCASDGTDMKCDGTILVGTTTPTQKLQADFSPAGYTKEMNLRGIQEVNGIMPPQLLGPGDRIHGEPSLKIGSTSAPYMVHNVTYQLQVGAAKSNHIEVAAPYAIAELQLVQGLQTLVMTVNDRAGGSANVTVQVELDTAAPIVIIDAPIVPELTYQGVPFAVELDVFEARGFNATVSVDGFSERKNASQSASLEPFMITRDTRGPGQLVIEVVDDLGNTFLETLDIETRHASTDSTIHVDVEPRYPLPGDKVTMEIEVRQKFGVTTLPFDVHVAVSDSLPAFDDEVEVMVDEKKKLVVEKAYYPGIHEFNATIFPVNVLFDCDENTTADGVCELDDSNQAHVGSFEVFKGRVDYNNQKYYIRAENRQAVSAVSTSGAIHELTLTEMGNKTVYTFTAGGKDLWWDPTERITLHEDPTDEDGEDSPGFGVVGLVGILAVAIARRRM